MKQSITEAEFLGVAIGVEEETGNPLLLITLRPMADQSWKTVHLIVKPENAFTLSEKIQFALQNPMIKDRFNQPESIHSLETLNEK